MSLIEDNKWYKRYKDEVKRDKLDLPALELVRPHFHIIIY
jgi:hypothetical protein